jgi:hypothetical protein
VSAAALPCRRHGSKALGLILATNKGRDARTDRQDALA